jgi:hypothetical protein
MSETETAWGHVPALRFSGYTSKEYLRLQYELKHREIPDTTLVQMIPIDDREFFDQWFSVRIQVGKTTLELQPEDVIMWLPHYVLHVQPTGEAFAYVPDGRMLNVVTEAMLS